MKQQIFLLISLLLPALSWAECIDPVPNVAATGNQYFVAISRPATCDFKLRSPITVKVRKRSDNLDHNLQVPVGLVWSANVSAGYFGNFDEGLSDNTTAKGRPDLSGSEYFMDNGVMAIIPPPNPAGTSKAYILAATNTAALPGMLPCLDENCSNSTIESKIPVSVASMASQQFFSVNTTMIEVANDDVVYPTGTIIVVYDDTPDYAGSMDVLGIANQATAVTNASTKITYRTTVRDAQ